VESDTITSGVGLWSAESRKWLPVLCLSTVQIGATIEYYYEASAQSSWQEFVKFNPLLRSCRCDWRIYESLYRSVVYLAVNGTLMQTFATGK
jgi:hypothetical protein